MADNSTTAPVALGPLLATDPRCNAQANTPPIVLGLRPREAAKAIGISARKLWEITNRREIPHVKLGRAIIYPVHELQLWLTDKAKGTRT